MSNSVIEWTAKTVAATILNSGRPKTWISDKSGIPYPTLNRKLKGHAEFRPSELLVIAELLDVHPALFIAPAFKELDVA